VADPSLALREQVGDWLARARAAGWLTDGDLAAFRAAEHATPADLFAGREARPLVVAFFGGTGVGKSTLLNRLAGAEVARVGVERPTSHEVTLYVHDTVALADLPDAFPVERVRVERHHDDRRRDVAWIDMPDIDSTATENRALALAWLPHVDLLIYVVSPERYRDDAGWRQLRARGHRHGWVFVMNRGDEGDPRQVADFAAELRDAGFAEPLVVGTVCTAAGMGAPDDRFAELEAEVRAVADAHGVQELERIGRRARLAELRAALAAAATRLGDAAAWAGLGRQRAEEWRRARRDVIDSLAWPVREVAGRVVLRRGTAAAGMVPAVGRLVRRLIGRPPDAPDAGSAGAVAAGEGDDMDLADRLWDAAAQDRLARALDRLEVEARLANVAVAPLLARLQAVVDGAPSVMGTSLRTALGRAIARPGTPVQRVARRGAKAAMAVLPAAAVVRVAYDVVAGYGRGVAGGAPFLGLAFAVHAALLIALAWLLPALLHHLLRPDLRAAVVRGLTAGLDAGLDAIAEELDAAFDLALQERQVLTDEVDHLSAAIDRQCRPSRAAPPPAVRRLLAIPSEDVIG
jgi:hypothetical protein